MKTKLDKILESVPAHTSLMISKSFDVSERILDILEAKGLTQKDLAEKLGKSESEISKWMKGTHNFTLETIAKIEVALGETIMVTPRTLKHEMVANVTKVVSEMYFDTKSRGGASISSEGSEIEIFNSGTISL